MVKAPWQGKLYLVALRDSLRLAHVPYIVLLRALASAVVLGAGCSAATPLPAKGEAADAEADVGPTDAGDDAAPPDADADIVVTTRDASCAQVFVSASPADPCEYPMPDASQLPKYFRSSHMNIQVIGGSGTERLDVFKVKDRAACGAPGGWLYDDDNMPTKVIFCLTTCQSIEPTDMVLFLLGCDPLPPPPPP